MRRSSLFLVAVLLSIAPVISSATSNSESGVPVSFTVLHRGFDLVGSAGDEKILESYRHLIAYGSALSRYHLKVGTVIDFSASQVVLITMGIQGSGGYDIAVQSVRDTGDYIDINVRLTSPGAGCVVTVAVTHPYRLLKIDSLKEVRTNERNVIVDCE